MCPRSGCPSESKGVNGKSRKSELRGCVTRVTVVWQQSSSSSSSGGISLARWGLRPRRFSEHKSPFQAQQVWLVDAPATGFLRVVLCHFSCGGSSSCLSYLLFRFMDPTPHPLHAAPFFLFSCSGLYRLQGVEFGLQSCLGSGENVTPDM